MSVAIERASAEHAAELTRLAHASKRHWGYPEEVIRSWRDQLTLTVEQISRWHVHVARAERQSAGFYALSGSAPQVVLEHLWVDPAGIGSGIGRRLFIHAVRESAALGALRIEIDSDPYARGFYDKMGAIETDRVPAPIPGEPGRYLPRMTYTLPK
ncbi:MAG: GNAT family N-acetyltransferase [bacterium]|nr:GNAT family N-acetyltransferase [bacterium]